MNSTHTEAIRAIRSAKRVRSATPDQRAYLASYGFDADKMATDLERQAALLKRLAK